MTQKIDPVCGMKVSTDSQLRLVHQGTTYYFCSSKCLKRFQAAPDQFNLEKARSTREPGRGGRLGDYVPLAVVVVVTGLAALARQWGGGDLNAMGWMHDFMGLFFVLLAALKLFNLKGFVDGFGMYDLLASRWKGWGYVYPFLELGLGLAYLARWQPGLVYALTVGLLVFGAVGVLNALRRGLDVECACMGSALRVPLSTVALFEDLGMAAMAGSMLAMRQAVFQ